MSLRLRLLLLLGISWLLLGGATTFWMYQRTSAQYEAVLDSRLAASAGMVGRLAAQLPLLHSVSAEDHSSLDVLARDGVACEVSEWRAEVLARTVARTAGSPRLHSADAGFGFLTQKGVEWRTYVLEQGDLRIAVADRMDLRAGLRREVAWAATLPLVISFLVGLPLLWLGIGRGLAPLERLRRSLSAEGPVERIVLADDAVPRDLAPFTRTIARLLARMKGTLQRERRFADNAAHEMRTPLTVVKTHLQVLQKLGAAEADPRWQTALASALSGTERLRHLLDQLLELTRVERGVCSDAPADVADAVHLALEGLTPGRITLSLPPVAAQVAVPQALLVSALRNLVENALKYSSADLPVHVLVAVQNGMVEFRVLDQGQGLSAEAMARAPEPFWRGDQSTPGSGLGLAIVSSISEHFQGTFSLGNAAGGGLDCRLAFASAA